MTRALSVAAFLGATAIAAAFTTHVTHRTALTVGQAHVKAMY